MLQKITTPARGSRLLHTTTPNATLRQKQLPKKPSGIQRAVFRAPLVEQQWDRVTKKPETREEPSVPAIKRNELGVQLLSRELHEQIFRDVSFPAPSPTYTKIAQEHLRAHGLDPAQGSVLPDIGFTLPPLQGRNLDQHFHAIGASAAQPWLDIAKELAGAQLPPKPDHWNTEPGWTKYHYLPDGSSYCTRVEYPEHDGIPEEMLVFDVETLPEYSHYAIMACAVSKNSWYSWVSPWLLGETEDTNQLIPLGDRTVPRVVVGHNVSFDRKRILEEYTIDPTNTRFLDTMSLHVAVKGISSHQRPAWSKYRKSQDQIQAQKMETVHIVTNLIRETEEKLAVEVDPDEHARLEKWLQQLDESLPVLLADVARDADEHEEEIASKRWEDLTSANSLADVAKLYCDITIEKDTRNDFLKCSREEIFEGIQDYLNYCSFDVAVTHAVFSKTLPAFLTACPSPVSFAGILTMGSSLLTVNQEWESYIANAERTYRELEDRVRQRLIELAHKAKGLVDSGAWTEDVWLSQLDWTPKVAGKTRGISPSIEEAPDVEAAQDSLPVSQPDKEQRVPAWYAQFQSLGPFGAGVINHMLPLLLRLSYDGHPLRYSTSIGWHYVTDGEVKHLPTAKGKTRTVLSGTHGIPALKSGLLSGTNDDLLSDILLKGDTAKLGKRIAALAEQRAHLSPDVYEQDPWLQQLDWKPRLLPESPAILSKPLKKARKQASPKPSPVLWPKWYWDLAKPRKDAPPGSLDLTVRNRLAPLLLRLSWQGWPLFHSREHGWTFRVPSGANFETRTLALTFGDPADEPLTTMVDSGFTFYKLPHKDGEKANVGSPLGKTFIKFAQDGTLTSPGDEAKEALDMNAQCSYWISARDRVLNQMVVWQDDKVKLGVKQPEDPSSKWGVILPQVITMGTVTRRAIEKTWLTASNAKKNRVGSELKAMVRAPEGYAIVGADVDSEELWISSVMGDAQFGLHGATAIGWMTLEGTKAAGTDLHSKTASILGISRDQAKVFNYSRIYGAGMRHAQLLLLQSNAGMLPEQAQKLAQNLYASTKGKNTHRPDLFGRKFWFGGTESYVFNKLEEIAMSDKPQTPALGCGVTSALSKEHLPATFGEDYMPSRINWVVQSSGVDYLHLLIVAMQHLISKYGIQARYLISVHDELRYLVKEEDRYRCALALQIANLWTRSLFAFKLGMDDLPQSVAFFSSVDIDKVLRKEVDMPCVTPSQPVPIPPGESLDIIKVLEKTGGGSLWPEGSRMSTDDRTHCGGSLVDYRRPNCLTHRAESAAWLRAQATSDVDEIKRLAQVYSGEKARTKAKKRKSSNASSFDKLRKVRALGNGDGVDWTNTVESLLKSLNLHP